MDFHHLKYFPICNQPHDQGPGRRIRRRLVYAQRQGRGINRRRHDIPLPRQARRLHVRTFEDRL